MTLKEIVLCNFRSYRSETRIPVSDLTAFIGKNDIGKSTILEALEIFFNNDAVKIEPGDACVHGEERNVEIGCVFTDLPEALTIDATSVTTLHDEFLLNADGDLEIRKTYNCSVQRITPVVHAYAVHPTAPGAHDLLLLKQTELQQRLAERDAARSSVDQRRKPDMRQAIRESFADLALAPTHIALDREDAKGIWQQLEKALPTFALFRADRPSRDEDGEVQDPMKAAVQEAIRSVQNRLDEIKDIVQASATGVAEATIAKLREMDEALATALSPRFREEPKWASLFKLSLSGDDEIPINKRGSGVRRLVLLSFFRAEAERRQSESGAPGVIYAIEEPETSQHPHNQRLLLQALSDIASRDGCQVILTTHVPGLAGYLPTTSVRYVSRTQDGQPTVEEGTDTVLERVASELGVVPDNRVRVLVCVEGPNDIAFLNHVSAILHAHDATLPDLSADPRVACMPLGGSTLAQWVHKRYLAGFGRPEVHVYDRDDGATPKYQAAYEAVNARADGSCAFITGKRELENYLHPDAIEEALEVEIAVTDTNDVPTSAAEAIHSADAASSPWDTLDEKKKSQKEGRAKARLNDLAARHMTCDRLTERDPDGEVKSWLRAVARLIEV